MRDRIIKFLAAEKISPAEFADKIGVQRSSMSHILNGRNYPSAAFLQKMLQAYHELNPRWLMIGDGSMNMAGAPMPAVSDPVQISPDESAFIPDNSPADDQEAEKQTFSVSGHERNPSLVLPAEPSAGDVSRLSSDPASDQPAQTSVVTENREMTTVPPNQSSPAAAKPSDEKEIEQVLFFYKDKTFRIYRPS